MGGLIGQVLREGSIDGIQCGGEGMDWPRYRQESAGTVMVGLSGSEQASVEVGINLP